MAQKKERRQGERRNSQRRAIRHSLVIPHLGDLIAETVPLGSGWVLLLALPDHCTTAELPSRLAVTNLESWRGLLEEVLNAAHPALTSDEEYVAALEQRDRGNRELDGAIADYERRVGIKKPH